MPPPPTPAGSITFELGPSFAAKDAALLHDAIASAAPGTPVEIRFHKVRECEDAALAVLARDLTERRADLAVRGLSQHQLRVLGYLGVDATAEPH